jgi:hypothetical protein
VSRVYSVEFENVAVTTVNGDHDLFYIAPADDKPVRLISCYLSNTSNADVGDAQEEMLRLRIIRGHATVGSGGATPTPAPLNPNDAAAGFTARTVDTTIASAGTLPMCSQAQTTIVVRLMAGPTDDITMSGTLYVEEI